MAFVIKAYNVMTGHVETVSTTILDPAEDNFAYSSANGYRADLAAAFAWMDSSDTHVYYADEVMVAP